MTLRSRPLLLALIAFVAAAGAWWLFSGGAPAAGGRNAALPVPVRAAVAEQRDVPLDVQSVGMVQPRESVAVRPRVDGQVVAVHFRDGDKVAEGQKLFTLDPRVLKAQLAQAEAIAAKDRATLVQARADIGRYAQLMVGKFASQQRYDQAKATVDAAAAAVAADEAQVDNLRAQLSYTEITSPIAGRAGTIAATLGAVVKSADPLPLVTINMIQPVRVQMSLPQRYLVPLRRALAVGNVEVRAARQETPAEIVLGNVEYVDNALDQQTGAFIVKAAFANQDESLWPGMFVNAQLRLTIENKQVVVPSAAVRTNQQGTYVFIVGADKKVKVTPVKIARPFGDFSIVESGIKAGETVVTEGQLRLADGARVEIRDTPTAGDGASGGPG